VPVICGMGRTVFKDLERTWEAVRHAQRPRVHMVLATSEIHMKHKLHMRRDQVRCCCCHVRWYAVCLPAPCAACCFEVYLR
jgi:isopropylmalate/homocitrate/citramalate synthase